VLPPSVEYLRIVKPAMVASLSVLSLVLPRVRFKVWPLVAVTVNMA